MDQRYFFRKFNPISAIICLKQIDVRYGCLSKLDLFQLSIFRLFLTLQLMKYTSILAFLLLLVLLNCCQQGCASCYSYSYCYSCSIGYYWYNGICYACHSACNSCTYYYSCQTCKNGFSLFGGYCITCPSNCTSCGQYYNYQKYCLSCASGYYLSQDQCLPNNSESSTEIITIVISSVFGCLFILLLSCAIYGLIKRRQAMAAQEMPPRVPAPIHAPVNLSLAELIYAEKIQWKLDGEKIDMLDDCVICQSQPGNCIISCQHTYHPRCIRDWLAKNKTCPMCRKTVDNMVTIVCKSCHKSTFYKPLAQVVILKDTEVECCSFCNGG